MYLITRHDNGTFLSNVPLHFDIYAPFYFRMLVLAPAVHHCYDEFECRIHVGDNNKRVVLPVANLYLFANINFMIKKEASP